MPSIYPFWGRCGKSGCSGWDSRAKISATGRPAGFQRRMSVCASSWRNCLTVILMSLLLDEPTNHLDNQSPYQWLEDFLITSAEAAIVIQPRPISLWITSSRAPSEVTMGTYLWLYPWYIVDCNILGFVKNAARQQMKQYEEQQKMIQETKRLQQDASKELHSKTLQSAKPCQDARKSWSWWKWMRKTLRPFI